MRRLIASGGRTLVGVNDGVGVYRVFCVLGKETLVSFTNSFAQEYFSAVRKHDQHCQNEREAFCRMVGVNCCRPWPKRFVR